ncbi:hypothetical protein [Lysinibacillus sp. BNK-21]|uniref:hypothetical protein n=1 Tax=Lysinibacillus sp. BNK-21 TaxID=3376156 RepID=UPI003B4324C4
MKEKEEFAGAFHYKDEIYECGEGCNINFNYIWCEYQGRFHTPFKIQYHIKAYYAEETTHAPNRNFEKREHIINSGWKDTPQQCREDFEKSSGIKLGRFVKEDTIGFLPPNTAVQAEFEQTNSTDIQY